jgi:hypothetical protein
LAHLEKLLRKFAMDVLDKPQYGIAAARYKVPVRPVLAVCFGNDRAYFAHVGHEFSGPGGAASELSALE